MRKSYRLKNYNYSSNGYYFITIYLKNRTNYFGKIKNEKMILNKLGEIVKKYWMEIPKHFKHVYLDEFIIMTDHMHGILIIKQPISVKPIAVTAMSNNMAMTAMSKTKNINDQFNKNFYSKISPKSNSIPTIIRSFKSVVSKIIHQLFDENFQWQSRYYDYIIRNKNEFNKIRIYIKNNPIQWELKNIQKF